MYESHSHSVKFLISLLLILASSQAFAAKAEKVENSGWSILGLIGSDYRAEETSDGYLEGKSYLNFALGIGFKPMLYILETSTAKAESGNASLSVDTEYSDYLLWAYFRPAELKISQNFAMEAFMGGGLGVYDVEVTTQVLGAETVSKSKNKMTGGLAVGIRPVIDYLWLSFEVRVRAGEDFEPNPTLSLLGRAGLSF